MRPYCTPAFGSDFRRKETGAVGSVFPCEPPRPLPPPSSRTSSSASACAVESYRYSPIPYGRSPRQRSTLAYGASRLYRLSRPESRRAGGWRRGAGVTRGTRPARALARGPPEPRLPPGGHGPGDAGGAPRSARNRGGGQSLGRRADPPAERGSMVLAQRARSVARNGPARVPLPPHGTRGALPLATARPASQRRAPQRHDGASPDLVQPARARPDPVPHHRHRL